MNASRENIDIIIDEAKPHHRQFLKIVRFTHSSTKAAACMLIGAIVALIVANSPACEPFVAFWETEVIIGFGETTASMSLAEIINDILMVFFFLLVGLEIKYEMTVGELTNIRQAILSVGAAFGGVIVPILIYLLFNGGNAETVMGWGIPSATDIAFALGILSLLGSRVPSGVRVFLSTLAVADDIIAILIIAIFYGSAPSLMWLAAAAAVMVILVALNRSHIYSLTPYILVGCVLWYCIFMSGVHSTIAGVLLAFTIPSGSVVKLKNYLAWSRIQVREVSESYDPDEPVIGQEEYLENVSRLAEVSHRVVPPVTRLERKLYPWVYFAILPLFALTNADVSFMSLSFGDVFGSSVFYGVFFGLVLGKPIGIMLMSFIIVKTGLSELPENVNWVHMLGASILGGVGFTMGIFVTNLAFADAEHIAIAKIAILLASLVAGVAGFVFLFMQAKLASARGEQYDVQVEDPEAMQSYEADEVRRRKREADLTGEIPAIRYVRNSKGEQVAVPAGRGVPRPPSGISDTVVRIALEKDEDTTGATVAVDESGADVTEASGVAQAAGTDTPSAVDVESVALPDGAGAAFAVGDVDAADTTGAASATGAVDAIDMTTRPVGTVHPSEFPVDESTLSEDVLSALDSLDDEV